MPHKASTTTLCKFRSMGACLLVLVTFSLTTSCEATQSGYQSPGSGDNSTPDAGGSQSPQEVITNPDDLAVFTTTSGTWRVGKFGDGYLWTLDENPGWTSAMACNNTNTQKSVTIASWTLLLPPQSCKFAQNSAPVQLDGALIRKAIADGRWVPYSADRAASWPAEFANNENEPGSLQQLVESKYDPAGMNGTGSSDNLVGIISAQGGEYTTSRGAIDDADAQVIAIAVRSQNVAQYTDGLYNAAFASAGFPFRTPFDANVLRDPQKPVSGKQYEHRFSGTETTSEVESLIPDDDWEYDAAHLANTGWALWLGTEDPRIGMIVQSHAAFSLAGQPEYLREQYMEEGIMTRYRCNDYQVRAGYNCLTAMWRARDVARIVQADDLMLWSQSRVDEMYNETTAQIQENLDDISSAPVEASGTYAARIVSVPLDGVGCEDYYQSDGNIIYLLSASNFQDQQYGGTTAYLRARAGEPLGKELLHSQAEFMIARTLYIGGAAGIDGRRSIGEAGIPVGPCVLDGDSYRAGVLPFSDRRGWAAWVETQDIMTREGYQPSTTDFENTYAHSALQADFILRAAQQLSKSGKIDPLEDIDQAIEAVNTAVSRTPSNSMRFRLWYKHTADVIP